MGNYFPLTLDHDLAIALLQKLHLGLGDCSNTTFSTQVGSSFFVLNKG